MIRFKSLASFKRSFSCLMTAQIEGKSIFLKVLPELKVSWCLFFFRFFKKFCQSIEHSPLNCKSGLDS